MKHIKSYRIFESFQEVTKDDMDSLVDTLTTEVFDEFDIYHDVDRWKDESPPYWEYIMGSNRRIIIGNLESDVYTQVINILHSIRKTVYGRTGLEYTFQHEVFNKKGFITLTIFKDSNEYKDPY